ncbi:unnamed protein product [Fusarium graminearum]|nr:unnamed protein product [Fusarium graminearum]
MLLGRNRLLSAYAVLAMIWLSLFQLCRIYTYYDPSSFFYDPRKAYETRYTDLRERDADHLLNTLHHASIDKLSNVNSIKNDVDIRGQDKRICIGIPSVRREKQHFLPRTMASLVEGLDAGQRSALRITVLLADDDPMSHPAFGQEWLHVLADEVLLYGNDSSSVVPNVYRYVQPFASEEDKTLLRNDRVHRDYATLMANCRATEAQYFVLMEDDVIAGRHWLNRLLDGLEYLERTDKAGNWLYLRLFYSETYLGWNSEQWPEYLVRSFCFYTMVLSLYLVVVAVDTRRRSHTFHYKAHGYNVLHLTFWSASFIALYFMAGRLTVDSYNEGIQEMPNYGCCAQGLVIPQQHLLTLENALHAAADDIAGDSLIEKFAGDQALKKYAIVPSLLQHVGIKGSSDAQGNQPSGSNTMTTHTLQSKLRALKVLEGASHAKTDFKLFPNTPHQAFETWLDEAIECGVSEPHAVTLSTIDQDGRPDARILILKNVDDRGWHFATKADSPKGRQISMNNNVALTFYWPGMGRQIRLRGKAVSLSRSECDADFSARSTMAQVTAIVSKQSEPLLDPFELETSLKDGLLRQQNKTEELSSEGWVVYAVSPDTIEFWQASSDRLHQRLKYSWDAVESGWCKSALWP